MKIKKIAATNQRVQQKKKVAAYCRVSTGRTAQEESLETQQDYYSRYITCNPEWSFAGVYSDVRSGLSAEKRPGFLKMIQDALDGKIDIILCKSISRFSRNITECQRYTSKLSSQNVVVVFEKERLKTDEPTSNLIFSLMCAIEQDESRSISENLKTAIRKKVAAGEYTPHHNLILGYDVQDGKYVPNKDAMVIEIIFRLYAEGNAVSDICKLLNSLKFHRKYVGKPFVHQVMQRILTNETYVGDKKLQKEAPKDFITKRPDPLQPYRSNYLTDDHPAIVTREIWDCVQARLRSEKAARKAGVHHQVRSHEFYGKVFCGCCGAPYQRRMRNTNSVEPDVPEYVYVWSCKERLKGKKGNGCKNNVVREEVLEQVFFTHPGQQLIIKEKGIEWKKLSQA